MQPLFKGDGYLRVKLIDFAATETVFLSFLYLFLVHSKFSLYSQYQ